VRNQDAWRPSKYVQRFGAWVPSRDPAELGVGSRFVAALALARTEPWIRNYARGHLLDLGCGSVPYFGIYCELVSRATCIDWPHSANDLRHIDAAADLASPLPFRESVFDTVLATDVLEHVPRPEMLINEIARVLRRDGYLILSVPFFYWVHEEPHDYYRYTEYALTRFCTEAGLVPTAIEQYGGAPEIVLDILLKHLAYLAPVCSPLCSSLALRISRWRLTKRISNWVTNFPLGYCLVAQKPPDG
jgi:SAM-dependent methyltransferase